MTLTNNIIVNNVAGWDGAGASFLDTLAAAYAESGQFADAVRTQKEAIALLHDEARKADFMSRLRLFEAGRAYHQSAGEKGYKGVEVEEPER